MGCGFVSSCLCGRSRFSAALWSGCGVSCPLMSWCEAGMRLSATVEHRPYRIHRPNAPWVGGCSILERDQQVRLQGRADALSIPGLNMKEEEPCVFE